MRFQTILLVQTLKVLQLYRNFSHIGKKILEKLMKKNCVGKKLETYWKNVGRVIEKCRKKMGKIYEKKLENYRKNKLPFEYHGRPRTRFRRDVFAWLDERLQVFASQVPFWGEIKMNLSLWILKIKLSLIFVNWNFFNFSKKKTRFDFLVIFGSRE